jgi:hypothetical protein
MLAEEALAGKLQEEPRAPAGPLPGALPETEPTDRTAEEPPSEYTPAVRHRLPPVTVEPESERPCVEEESAPPARAVSVRVRGVVRDVPSEELAALVPPGPGERVAPYIEITPREYTDEARAMIMSEVSVARREDLMGEIDGLYGIVSTRLAAHQEHSGTALKLLHEARSILIERPYAFADAELRMQAAKTLIKRTEDSRRTSRRNWPWLLAYELLWAFALLMGLVFEGVLGAWIGRLSYTGATTMQQIFPAWGTMMVGGIGGVVCALWSMWYHISDKQDYDSQHNLWYLVQPFQGLVLGIIVYLVVAAGFLAFQADITSPNASAAAKYFPWLIAGIAGIRQTFFYELLDRIIGVLNPGSSKTLG